MSDIKQYLQFGKTFDNDKEERSREWGWKNMYVTEN